MTPRSGRRSSSRPRRSARSAEGADQFVDVRPGEIATARRVDHVSAVSRRPCGRIGHRDAAPRRAGFPHVAVAAEREFDEGSEARDGAERPLATRCRGSWILGPKTVQVSRIGKWTRSLPIRTAARMPLEVALVRTRASFSYQAIAARAAVLKRLGMTASAIARVLGVTDKTVTKAIRWGAPRQTPLPADGRRSSRSSALPP
jgi:hypothetical protein